MKVHLSCSTAGRYGSIQLKGILKHFDRYIQQKINENKFESSFEKLYLTFAYPPLFMLPNVVSMRKDFLDRYEKLPHSRILRRYKKIDITIKLPEFSEHFDLERQQQYKDKYSIDKKYKDLKEVKLANVMIDKYIEAIELIEPKIKSTDNFDFIFLKKILNSIRPEISVEFLKKNSKGENEKVKDEILARAIQLREKRTQNIKEGNKRIRALRVYSDLPPKILFPYDYQYTEIFVNLLARYGLKCPGYHHLYIQVAETKEDALRRTTSMVDWYVDGIAVINLADYKQKNKQEQSKIVFDLICEGLLDIAKIDNLDIVLIQKVIDKIKEKHLDTELIFRVKEHKKYKLTITYFARSREDQCPIFFNIENKETNKEYRVKIGKADKYQIWLWLQKINLTQNKIKIKSSDSIHANVWLKNKKREMVFDLEDLMIEENEKSS